MAERTPRWLMLHRRPVRVYEALPTSSEVVIHITMIHVMTSHRRIHPVLARHLRLGIRQE
ncbi:hypothetical protein GCM10020216_037170 [Nonomuraea helvata]